MAKKKGPGDAAQALDLIGGAKGTGSTPKNQHFPLETASDPRRGFSTASGATVNRANAGDQHRLRLLLTEATEHRLRGDEAGATYLEMLAAVWIRMAEIQGRAA